MKFLVLSLSLLAFSLAACGDNIHPPGADVLGDDCLDEHCPSDVDQPDGGTPTPDADTGGDVDGGTGPGPDGGTGTDGGSGGGTDGGTGGTDGGTGGTDGGTDPGECGTCPEGQVCVDGTCVCDGEPEVVTCDPDEVRLCHVPPGNPDGAHVICVGGGAQNAHLNHGDTLGDCP
jgi:hypothetical protein